VLSLHAQLTYGPVWWELDWPGLTALATRAGQCFDYRIQSGDSLFLIASRLGTTPHQIKLDNPASFAWDPTGNTIYAGSTLRICRGACHVRATLGMGGLVIPKPWAAVLLQAEPQQGPYNA
jgi:hypothetical protein